MFTQEPPAARETQAPRQVTTDIQENLDGIDRSSIIQNLQQNLKVFIKFPELPAEIRLQIWRAAFPRGREVNLGDLIILASKGHMYGSWRVIEDCAILPVTLCINAESREETLKHYCMIPRAGITGAEANTYTWDYNLNREKQPFCFNPKLDTAWIHSLALQSRYSNTWFASVHSQAPALFSKIKTIEVRSWNWHIASVIDRRGAGEPEYVRRSSRDGPNILSLAPFLRFTGLEELKFIRSNDSSGTFCTCATSVPLPSWAMHIQPWFEQHKDVFGGNVPVVAFFEN